MATSLLARDHNHDGPDEQVADDAETEERFVRGDVVGRRGRVALHEQSAGNVEDADRAGDGEEQVQESGDSPGVAGWRSTLEILRRGPDDDLDDFHLGRLLDHLSDARLSRRSD